MAERCGKKLLGGKVCGRPAGHNQRCRSSESLAAETRHKQRRYAPEKDRKRKLRRLYGLSPEQYQEMLDAQSGRCWICERKPKQYLTVDHNHRTGVVRGLLCAFCNTMLGYMHENARLLTRAGHYLDSPPAIDVIGIHRVPGAPPLKIELTKLSTVTENDNDAT